MLLLLFLYSFGGSALLTKRISSLQEKIVSEVAAIGAAPKGRDPKKKVPITENRHMIELITATKKAEVRVSALWPPLEAQGHAPINPFSRVQALLAHKATLWRTPLSPPARARHFYNFVGPPRHWQVSARAGWEEAGAEIDKLRRAAAIYRPLSARAAQLFRALQVSPGPRPSSSSSPFSPRGLG